MQRTASSERWWELPDSTSSCAAQLETGFRLRSSSSCLVGPSCISEFDFTAVSEPTYPNPNVIPFSPSYSPVQMNPGVDAGDLLFEGTAYWLGPYAEEDAQLASPQSQWSDIPNCAPNLWSTLMLAPTFDADVPSPPTSYRFPSSTTSASHYPRIAPRLRPRAPSPSSSSGRLSPLSAFTSSASSSRRSSVDTPSALSFTKPTRTDTNTKSKCCSHCSATSTPLWRRNPATREPLCNACGLYLQQRGSLRPLALIEFDALDSCSSPLLSPHLVLTELEDADPDAPECSHCHTRRTSVWRRHKITGAKLCNACGVYSRLRGKDRPLELRRERVRPRGRHPK